MTLDTAVLADLAEPLDRAGIEAFVKAAHDWVQGLATAGEWVAEQEAVRLRAAALLSEVERLRKALRETAEYAHRLATRGDPAPAFDDCENPVCLKARAALVSEEGSR